MSKPSLNEFVFKVVAVGDSSVGKTSMILRYTDDCFSESFITTIGVDFRIKSIEVSGVTVKMHLWDTAGQDRFRSITSSFYRGADCVLIVFDVTNKTSFNNVHTWLSEVGRYGGDHSVQLLVGNKLDMADKRQVSEDEARMFAQRAGLRYIETSAKDSTNLQEMFTSVARELVERLPHNSLQQQQQNQPELVIGGSRSRHQEGLCFGANTCVAI